MIDEVNRYGNILFEIANEDYYDPGRELSLCDCVRAYEAGKPKQHLVMPRDFPNHDYAGIKTWDLPRLRRELLKARDLGRPLIWCTGGIGDPGDATIRKAPDGNDWALLIRRAGLR